MSFFSRKKKEEAAASPAAPAAAPASFGYPGVVGGSAQPSPPFPYPQYPAAVAGYQPPAFHNGQSASSSPSPVPYQPSATAAYALPAGGGGSSLYQHQSPPPPLNPHAVASSQPPQPQQQQYGGYAMQGQYLPQQQSQYGQAPQASYHHHQQQQPSSSSSQQPQPPAQQAQSAYSNYSRYQPQPSPSQQPPVSYQFAPASNNSAPSSQPQYAAPPPQSQLYQNGYGQQQQPQPQYAAAYSMQPKAQAAAPYALSSPQSAADMKPYETPQQAAARLARAEASEHRLGDKASNGSVGGKQKTWAAYQEIEREEREKQQRIAQRQQQQQQQQQQPSVTASAASELDVSQQSSPHYHQLNSPATFSTSQFAPVQFEQPAAHQQQQQSIPDLLTWDVHAAPVSDSRREDPPTPRAADQQAEQHEEDEDGKDDQKRAVLMAARQQQQQQMLQEEEDDDEDDEDEEDARADERKQQQRQQQAAAVEEQEGGQEGQSWQQIGKGRRPVDELDATDSHGEGQTKDEPPVAVAHLIDYAEKQEESLNQPLLSPASAAHARAAAAGSDLSLLAPAPLPSVAASSFDFLSDSSSNSQPLLSSPKAAAAGSAVVQSGGTVTVLAPPKRIKKKKAQQAADAASVPAANAALPKLSNASNAYGSQQQQQAAPSSHQHQQHQQQPQQQPQQWASPPPQQVQQLQSQLQQPPMYQQPHPQQQQQLQQQAPAASQQSSSSSASVASAAAMSSPYAQRLYAGFAFQLYTDTSTHELFLFYEPHDGPRGTLYWCQPGKREKNSQHSMAIHDITHSVLGKHNFPMVNARAVAAAPIQCFTLYDKQKRLDMAADSGANREEFLQCLENVIRDGHQIQPAAPVPAVQQQQPQQQSSAVTAVRSQPVAAAVPAQLVSASPSQHQQQQAAAPASLASYYAPPPVQQSQPAMSYPMAYPHYPNAFPAQAVQASYPALQQPQQPPVQQAAPFNFQYGVVPGMSRQPASQPLQAQPAQQQLLQGYPAYMQQQQLAQPLMPPQLVQENPDLIRPVHAGLRCDSCGVSPIKDVRYKCTLCFNFDLCERCEKKGKHPKSHPLLKMHACGRSRDVAELFHRAQYKELQQQQLSKRSGLGGPNGLLTEDARFDAYHKDMLSRVMAQAHTLPPDTMRHLIEILVQLMTATDETREAYAHIRLRDDSTQRLLLPFPVALDILRLCGFDYVQAKSSGDNLSFQGMEQFDELYFNPSFKLTVVETVVERLLRL